MDTSATIRGFSSKPTLIMGGQLVHPCVQPPLTSDLKWDEPPMKWVCGEKVHENMLSIFTLYTRKLIGVSCQFSNKPILGRIDGCP